MANRFEQPNTKEPKKRKTPEITADSLIEIGKGIYKLKKLWDNKGEDIKRVFQETKEAIKRDPFSIKDLATAGGNDLGRIVIQNENETTEREMQIKNRVLKSSLELEAEEEKLATLKRQLEMQEAAIKAERERLTREKQKDTISPEQSAHYQKEIEKVRDAKLEKARTMGSIFFEALIKTLAE